VSAAILVNLIELSVDQELDLIVDDPIGRGGSEIRALELGDGGETNDGLARKVLTRSAISASITTGLLCPISVRLPVVWPVR
jgi:hypothetical protein